MEIQNTRDVRSNGVKILMYGASGVGKTYQARYLRKGIILSAESGLLSLADCEVPYIDIKTEEDIKEAYRYLAGNPDYETIFIDSLSEIGEIILSEESARNKDNRTVHTNYKNITMDIVKAFKHIKGQNVVYSAKLEKMQDDMGKILYGPSMPGKKVGPLLPYEFDEVYALRAEKGQDGTIVRMFQTYKDDVWEGKNRAGQLEPWEEANIQNVIDKILGIPNASAN